MGIFKQATSGSTQRTAGVRLFAGTKDARKVHFAKINEMLQEHKITTILNYDETQVSGYNVSERMKGRDLKRYTTVQGMEAQLPEANFAGGHTSLLWGIGVRLSDIKSTEVAAITVDLPRLFVHSSKESVPLPDSKAAYKPLDSGPTRC